MIRQSASFVRKKKEKKYLYIGLGVVGAITWFFIFFWFLASSLIGIQGVIVTGVTATSSAENMKISAENILDQKYLGLIPKSNAFLYPKKTISRELLSSFPELSSVEMDVQGLHDLRIYVTQKIPVAIVCSGLPDLTSSGTAEDACFFTDSAGIMFAIATGTRASGLVLNKYYFPDLSVATTASSAILGKKATSTSEFANLQEFVTGAKSAGLKPIATLIKEDGEYEMYVKGNTVSTTSENDIIGKLSTAVVVYIDDLRKESNQLANLITFWRNKKADLDYIDVRFGSSIYYRKSNQ